MTDSNSLLPSGGGDDSENGNQNPIKNNKAIIKKNKRPLSTISKPHVDDLIAIYLTKQDKEKVIEELKFIKGICDGSACYLVNFIADKNVIKDSETRKKGKELQNNFLIQREEILKLANELAGLNQNLMKSLSITELDKMDPKDIQFLLAKLKAHKQQIEEQKALLAKVNEFYCKNSSHKGNVTSLITIFQDIVHTTKTSAQDDVLFALKCFDATAISNLFPKIIKNYKSDNKNYSEIMADACKNLEEAIKEKKLNLEIDKLVEEQDITKFINKLFAAFNEAKAHEFLIHLASKSPFSSKESLRKTVEALHIEEYRKKFGEDPKPVYFVG